MATVAWNAYSNVFVFVNVRHACDYESGAKAGRPQFRQLFEDAARRKFDLVLFWALDRLSREGVDSRTICHPCLATNSRSRYRTSPT